MPEDPRLTRRDVLRGRLIARFAQSLGNELTKVQAAALGAAPSGGKPAGAEPPSGPGIGRRYALPIHRPPGAVDEATFLAGCTRCGECITACPVSAIVIAPARFREAAGTPMIDPHSSACVMCPDAPCITSCSPGVLRLDQPRTMGVAWIQPMACLAHTVSFCSVCAERCPVKGAIEVVSGKPAIHADACTGCGVCMSVCPAPSNAIVIMPLADRPSTSVQPTLPSDPLEGDVQP